MPKIRYDGNAASAVKAAKDLADAQKKTTTIAGETAKSFGKAGTISTGTEGLRAVGFETN